MSADTIVREPALTEKLQQLIGAIKMLQKMVGNDDQTWLAENVAEARSKGPESAAEVFKIAIANLHATVAKCTPYLWTSALLFGSVAELPSSDLSTPF